MDFDKVEVRGEEHMLRLGAALGRRFDGGELVFLHGDLGAGKTTLVRGILRGLGHDGPVPSPTYTLLEPYEGDRIDVVHMDLYRVQDPEELEMLGVRDLVGDRLCLVEWPERGVGMLPDADVDIHITGAGDSRRVTVTWRE